MVAKVISGKNIRGVLNYNENKVRQGQAQCILANQFPCHHHELTFMEKLNRFRKLISLNPKVRTNTLHISLNFDPSENLSPQALCKIASTYMQGIGFDHQPYLVYQHYDAGHPHVHIVTTNVQASGKRIDIHNMGRQASGKTRREIEIQFGLVRAERKKDQQQGLQPIIPEKVIYGKMETKRHITNVVRFVVQHYRFTSLPELNAVLRHYNVRADGGKEGSRMHTNKGLIYSVMDSHENPVGIPVKASSIYGKPTLLFLEKQFKLNEALRKPYRPRLRNLVNKILASNPGSTEIFRQKLMDYKIDVVFRKNEKGRVYGVTFVDHTSYVVFNGSDLGKAFSAAALLNRLPSTPTKPDQESGTNFQVAIDHPDTSMPDLGLAQTITDLVTSRTFDPTSPDAATRRKRKRRKRRALR
jgi:hypothetical protein